MTLTTTLATALLGVVALVVATPRKQSSESWATATALIGAVVLVLNYLRERGPAKTVNERLDTLESNVSKLQAWNKFE